MKDERPSLEEWRAALPLPNDFPAKHGQERPIVECPECGHAIRVVPADRERALKRRFDEERMELIAARMNWKRRCEEAEADNRALEESAAEFEAKFEQAAAEAETLEAERRALVEALREIANWDYGGQALRCNEMAQAALDRIGAGR